MERARDGRETNGLSLSRRAALTLLGAAALSCHSLATSDEPLTAERPKPRGRRPLTVLLAIDGVRWQDVFLGPTVKGRAVATTRDQLIPHLTSVADAGTVLGAPGTPGFYASGPNFVSLPGYMEMLSGSSKTGCTENDCRTMRDRTLMHDFVENGEPTGARAGIFSSWERIHVAAKLGDEGVSSTGRFLGKNLHQLEEFPGCKEALARGRGSTGGQGDFRHDRITADLTRAFLHEADPDFVFCSLGETDEHAHHGDYLSYLRALRSADQFVGDLRADLAAARRRGRETLLLITTDHGRSENFRDHGRNHPESSRSFLFAEGTRVRPGIPASSDPAYLKDIAPTIRALTGLPARNGTGSGRVLHEIIV